MHFALAALVLLAFAPFAWADLFWDDYLVIRPDGPIADLSSVWRTWFGRCILFPPGYDYPYYRPLIDISFTLEYALAGVHPFLYHLTNFALHLANALMAFAILRTLLGGRLLPAFVGAGLFALHPIQCESVLWPAARPAVLSLFFAQIAALCYLRLWRAGASPAWIVGVVGGFVAALLSKEVAVALLPPALLLFCARRSEPVPRRCWIAAALLGVALVAYLALNRAAGDSASMLSTVGIVAFAEFVFQIFGFYLAHLAAPFGFAPAYPVWAFRETHFLAIGALGAAPLLVAFGWGLWRRTPTAVLVAAGAMLFGGGAVLPALGGQLTVADRYVYQAMWGLGLLIAVAVCRIGETRKSITAAGVGLALLALLALNQSVWWSSSDMLWMRTVQVAPDSLEGNIYMGQYHERRGELAEAATCYERAAFPPRETSAPAKFDAALSLGSARLGLGEFDAADRALAIAEASPRHANNAIVRRAIVASASGNADAARAHIARFADSGKELPGIYINLALLSLRMEGDLAAAAAWYAKARARGAAPNAELETAGQKTVVPESP